MRDPLSSTRKRESRPLAHGIGGEGGFSKHAVGDSPEKRTCASDLWTPPDVNQIFRERAERLNKLRKDPSLLESVKAYYADDNYVAFINDWGMTRDPRLASEGKSPVLPFILFPRQIELLNWFDYMMKNRLRGNVDKTRDCGASWCALSYACYRFLFHKNNDFGFGSRKENLIDDKGDPKALFPKARNFIASLPIEFQPEGWNERRDAPYLKLLNPENGSTIIGEAGDNIGRGGRTLMYFVDEHAFVERAGLAEAALSENTNTQINISTHNGVGTLFYKQTHELPEDRIFAFDWKDDPRKSQEWYDKKKNDPGTDALIFAQEVDRDPSASVSDGYIDVKLISEAMNTKAEDVFPAGPWIVAVDVAGMGNDKSIINTRRGAVNFEQKKFTKKEGDQLAAEVERHVDKLLAQNVAALGAIIYELEGPGYGFHEAMKYGKYRKALRPMHPGRKLKSLEFFNERARFYGLALEWLEEGNKSIVFDKIMRIQASSLRYSWKTGPNGERKLLMEDKKEYKSRMASDPRNKMAGPSPDEADAWAMTFVPVRMEMLLHATEYDSLPFGMGDANKSGWQPLDAVVGY